jgi:hypothetical protein
MAHKWRDIRRTLPLEYEDETRQFVKAQRAVFPEEEEIEQFKGDVDQVANAEVTEQ